MCEDPVRSPQEQPHNSQPITLSVGELTQINNKRVCKHKYRVQIGFLMTGTVGKDDSA